MRPTLAFAVILALMLVPVRSAESWAEPPAESDSRDRLVQIFEVSGGAAFGMAEFHGLGRKLLAFWDDPFSGRASCIVRAYYFDPKRKKWTLFIKELVDNAAFLSAEVPVEGQFLVFRNEAGKVVLKRSLAKIPAPEQWRGW